MGEMKKVSTRERVEAERMMSRVETVLAEKVEPGENIGWGRGQVEVGEVHGEGNEGRGRRKEAGRLSLWQ
jgi:hypothetical protein